MKNAVKCLVFGVLMVCVCDCGTSQSSGVGSGEAVKSDASVLERVIIIYDTGTASAGTEESVKAFLKGKIGVYSSMKLASTSMGWFSKWSEEKYRTFINDAARKYVKHNYGAATEDKIKNQVGYYVSDELGDVVVFFKDGDKIRAVLKAEYETTSNAVK